MSSKKRRLTYDPDSSLSRIASSKHYPSFDSIIESVIDETPSNTESSRSPSTFGNIANIYHQTAKNLVNQIMKKYI